MFFPPFLTMMIQSDIIHYCMKCLYICNPMSGRKHKNNKLAINRLKQKYQTVDFVETQHKGHLTEILNQEYKNYDTIVLTGGDGTLDEAVNALAEKQNAPAIGYIPSGTCNDVARSLGIPKNVNKAIDIILRGNVFEYDLMKVNQRYCIYVCGIGVFTSTSYVAKQSAKRHFGWLAYFFCGLKDAFAGKTFDVKFENEQFTYQGKASLILFVNSKSVAGFKLNKRAVLDDGKVDVCIFCEKGRQKKVSLSSKIRIAQMFVFGYDRLKSNSRVKVFSTDHAKVQCCKTINCDGERGECADFELKVIQKGIRIIC